MRAKLLMKAKAEWPFLFFFCIVWMCGSQKTQLAGLGSSSTMRILGTELRSSLRTNAFTQRAIFLAQYLTIFTFHSFINLFIYNWNPTQGPVHSRQVLYHWASLQSLFFKDKVLVLRWSWTSGLCASATMTVYIILSW